MTDAAHPAVPVADVGTDYEIKVRLNASADTVFDAITSPASITAWWSPASGSGEAGGDLTLPMGPPEPLLMHVDRATRPETVQWTVTDCPFLEDWVGTRPTFTITRVDDDTSELQFRHHGLTGQLECMDVCAPSWDHYIGRSLRDFVEGGSGQPRGSEGDQAWRRELGFAK